MPTSNSKVMVVDDEPDILIMLDTALQKWDIQSETFSNPLKALESFETAPQDYSMILTDIKMPQMNGLELAIRELKIKPNVRLMFMTAFEITANELTTHVPGVMHEQILRKPFDMKRMHDSITKLLAE